MNKNVQKESFFRSLAPNDRYMIGNLFFLYLIQGIYTILIGSILPMIKAEYNLSYQIGGYLISAHSTGPIAPVSSMPRYCCRAITAALVRGPKMPSAAITGLESTFFPILLR